MRPIDFRLARVLAATALVATGSSTLAQPATYDEQPGQWTTQAPPPPAGDPGAYGPGYGPPPTTADVSVDLATPGASVSFGTFHDGLAPYGEWVSAGAYGRVWRPARVAPGWRPYYYGRWEWTDEGWLWVSDEPWGWATYHYGRWAYDSYYGWVWIPGYQWAPAWVTWRYSPEYIGWAPLGPGFSVYVTSYPTVYGWWTFVPCRRFVGVPVHSVAFTGRQVHGIYGATHPAPPRVMMGGVHGPAWGGPARPFIEQRVGRPVMPVRVQPVGSPRLIGTVQQTGLVQIYRPEARSPGSHGAPAMPANPGHPGNGVHPGAPPAGGVFARPVGQPQPSPGAITGAPAPQVVSRPVQVPTVNGASTPPSGHTGQPAFDHARPMGQGAYRPGPVNVPMNGGPASSAVARPARPMQVGPTAPAPSMPMPQRAAPSAAPPASHGSPVPHGGGVLHAPAPAAPPPARGHPPGAAASPPAPARAVASVPAPMNRGAPALAYRAPQGPGPQAAGPRAAHSAAPAGHRR